MKFFKVQPTTAMVKAILTKMNCQFITPEALRSKRVGKEFVAVVKMKTADDAQTVLKNKGVLRGTNFWVGPDKYESDWERQEQSSRREKAPPPKPRSMVSFPHTELWDGVFKDPPRSNYPPPSGNGGRPRRERRPPRGEDDWRADWQETRF